jgi:hypothetical protein
MTRLRRKRRAEQGLKDAQNNLKKRNNLKKSEGGICAAAKSGIAAVRFTSN